MGKEKLWNVSARGRKIPRMRSVLTQALLNTAGFFSNWSWSRAHVPVCIYRLLYTCFTASDSAHVTEGGATEEEERSLHSAPRLTARERGSHTHYYYTHFISQSVLDSVYEVRSDFCSVNFINPG